MARRLATLLVIVVLVTLGAVAVRAASWSPVAPAPLGRASWTPLVDAEPSHWQTLGNASFEAGGGSFVAELQGYRRMSAGTNSLLVRIVRLGGEDTRLDLTRAQLDGSPMEGAERGRDAVEARLAWQPPGPGPHSIAAELDLRVWRPVAWGYREAPPVHVVVAAQVEGPPPPSG